MHRPAKQLALKRVAQLAGQGLDLVSFWRESGEALSRAVPYYLTPCWFTLDPASLLITSHFQEGLPEIPAEWLAREYCEPDFNKMADVATSPRGAATLHDATRGEPERSPRYRRDMVPYGAAQEMITGLRTRSGEVWGAVGLYREPGEPLFEVEDLDFMVAAAPFLAEGARRALLMGEAADPDSAEPPGLIVLKDDWTVESMTPGLERWLSDLPGGGNNGALAPAVYAVAGQAMREAGDLDSAGDAVFARVLSRSGRWVVLHGTTLMSGPTRRAAVIIEPAHPARIAPLLMAVYQLTNREEEVTRLVLQGNSTAQIADALVISVHTVQQHLKSVFEKTGVRSRRDLVAKIFLSHYEPRVRDNERRTTERKAARGGPVG